MRVAPLSPALARLAALAVALSLALTACGDAPEPLDSPPEPVAVAPTAPATTPVRPEPAPDPDAEVGQEASAPAVTPQRPAPAPPSTPPAPRPAPAPSPETVGGDVISMPLPERPPMRAPEPAPANTAQADAFWAAFQQAVRSRDRIAIAAGLADEVRAGDRTFARSSEQVQAVIDAIVEEEAARDAYLAVDGLTHGPDGSTFETTAHYEIDGEPYDVVVFGAVAEVAPGDWRLVEVGSR